MRPQENHHTRQQAHMKIISEEKNPKGKTEYTKIKPQGKQLAGNYSHRRIILEDNHEKGKTPQRTNTPKLGRQFCTCLCFTKYTIIKTSLLETTSLGRGEAPFPFRRAPGGLAVRRYRVRFHHAAAAAQSYRGSCELPASLASNGRRDALATTSRSHGRHQARPARE